MRIVPVNVSELACFPIVRTVCRCHAEAIYLGSVLIQRRHEIKIFRADRTCSVKTVFPDEHCERTQEERNDTEIQIYLGRCKRDFIIDRRIDIYDRDMNLSLFFFLLKIYKISENRSYDPA